MKQLHRIKNILLWGIICASVAGCNREYEPVEEYLSTIFPLEQNSSRTYFVIDTSYASTALVEAKTYYKMEKIDGQETDLLGRQTNKLWIYSSPDDLGTFENPVFDWDFIELWTTIVDDGYAERIEGNTRLLVLKMPPYKGFSWNGNFYNGDEPDTYRYLSTDTTVVIFGKTYEHCVYVEQIPFRQPVSQPGGTFFLIEHAYEIYAPGIGKIERYFKYYEEQGGSIESDSKVYHERIVDYDS